MDGLQQINSQCTSRHIKSEWRIYTFSGTSAPGLSALRGTQNEVGHAVINYAVHLQRRCCIMRCIHYDCVMYNTAVFARRALSQCHIVISCARGMSGDMRLNAGGGHRLPIWHTADIHNGVLLFGKSRRRPCI